MTKNILQKYYKYLLTNAPAPVYLYNDIYHAIIKNIAQIYYIRIILLILITNPMKKSEIIFTYKIIYNII